MVLFKGIQFSSIFLCSSEESLPVEKGDPDAAFVGKMSAKEEELVKETEEELGVKPSFNEDE